MAREPEHRFSRVRAREAGSRPSKQQLMVAAGYVLASAVYIAVGVAYTDFLFSYFVALAYLLLVVWLVPAGVRRLF